MEIKRSTGGCVEWITCRVRVDVDPNEAKELEKQTLSRDLEIEKMSALCISILDIPGWWVVD